MTMRHRLDNYSAIDAKMFHELVIMAEWGSRRCVDTICRRRPWKYLRWPEDMEMRIYRAGGHLE